MTSLSSNNLTIETIPAVFTDEVYELYKKYQVAVHNDKLEELTIEKFSDFLVNSSLPCEPGRLGTHHQLYRIDGRLVAVGVIDLLPTSLSSVYCFYDPQLRHLALGKYSALCEISYCVDNAIEFYCLGFYIHSCAKMKYKGDYSPSELLCPTTLQWYPLDACRGLLDSYKFSPFYPEGIELRRSVDKELFISVAGESEKQKDLRENRLCELFGPSVPGVTPVDINCCPLRIENVPCFYIRNVKESFQKMLGPVLAEWVRLCGNDTAPNIEIQLS